MLFLLLVFCYFNFFVIDNPSLLRVIVLFMLFCYLLCRFRSFRHCTVMLFPIFQIILELPSYLTLSFLHLLCHSCYLLSVIPAKAGIQPHSPLLSFCYYLISRSFPTFSSFQIFLPVISVPLPVIPILPFLVISLSSLSFIVALSTASLLLPTASFLPPIVSSFPRRRESSTQLYFTASYHFYIKNCTEYKILSFLISGFPPSRE